MLQWQTLGLQTLGMVACIQACLYTCDRPPGICTVPPDCYRFHSYKLHLVLSAQQLGFDLPQYTANASLVTGYEGGILLLPHLATPGNEQTDTYKKAARRESGQTHTRKGCTPGRYEHKGRSAPQVMVLHATLNRQYGNTLPAYRSLHRHKRLFSLRTLFSGRAKRACRGPVRSSPTGQQAAAPWRLLRRRRAPDGYAQTGPPPPRGTGEAPSSNNSSPSDRWRCWASTGPAAKHTGAHMCRRQASLLTAFTHV